MLKNKIDDNFLYYLGTGQQVDLYNYFGAHEIKDENGNCVAVEFMLYAPNASSVNVMGTWNYFNETELSMERIHSAGIWYLKVDRNLDGERYKYVIHTYDGKTLYKADPYAFLSGLRPNKDSVICDIEGYNWSDLDWRLHHKKTYNEPMNIYELHLGSWKRRGLGDNDFLNYHEIADLLVPYLKGHKFSHVELMPVCEHPLDASWGYQGTGYYSATSRYGKPHDLMYFVDLMHQNNIGVIFDWVPGHICKDSHGLYMFDGTPLYEYSEERDRENVEWGTANLDLGKGSTRSFLYSNAMFYMRKYHADGFRVDAVSNIIYYLGDKNRGENTGACDFLRRLSELIFKEDDRVLLIAEDSSDYAGVTRPVSMGGLGFNYKWDMGWMNDTLKYFKLDPVYRKYHHNQLTFSMAYFYNEQFLMPFSHDEVVHMKGSLLNKMPGDYWQKFANFRLMIGYMMTHPGKKLLFMGSELAPFSEWAFYRDLDWNLMDYDSHRGANQYFKDLNALYHKEKALYELDYSYDGFKWIEADNADQSVFIYSRFAKNKDDHLVIIMNCTPNTYFDYEIGVPGEYKYREILNSDDTKYYGSGKVNPGYLKVMKKENHHLPHSIKLTIPPLGIIILKNVKQKKASK